MTAVQTTERFKRVAASFTRKYYTAFVENPAELAAFYTPTATSEHSGSRASGIAEIKAMLANLYPAVQNGVVNISDIVVEKTEGNKAQITIYGAFTEAGNNMSEREFTHVVHMVEHDGNSGNFGVVSDHRTELIAPKIDATTSAWALDTPPMFARKPAVVPDAAPLEAPVASPEVAPKEETRASPPAAAAACAVESPAAEPAEEGAASAVAQAPASASNGDAPAAAKPTPPEPTKPKSFIDAVLMKRSETRQTVPIKVQATSAASAAKKEEEAGADAAASATKSSSTHRGERGAFSGKRESKVYGDAPAGSRDAAKDGTTSAGAGGLKKRRDGEKTISRMVVFYDVIAKGLPQNITDEEIRELMSDTAPVKLVKIQSKPDKHEKDVTRTFAFVQLDHEAIVKAGGDVKATIAKVIADSKSKRLNGLRFLVDEVREKYTTAAPESAQ